MNIWTDKNPTTAGGYAYYYNAHTAWDESTDKRYLADILAPTS